MKRRGSLLDLIGIIVVCLVIVFSFLLGAVLWHDSSTKMNATITGMGMSNTEFQRVLVNTTTANNAMLDSIPLIIIGMAIAGVVSAFLVPTHPAFLPISLLFLTVVMFCGFVFSDVMYAFATNAHIISTANAHPAVVLLIQYIGQIIGVFGFIILWVMHSRPQSIGGGTL